MKPFDEIKELLLKHKEELRRQYGVKEIGIFGSYIRGEQKDGSDLDILIELEKPIGFVRFMKLHKIIQTVMGWTNTHLHQFRIYNDVYCEPDEEIYHDTSIAVFIPMYLRPPVNLLLCLSFDMVS